MHAVDLAALAAWLCFTAGGAPHCRPQHGAADAQPDDALAARHYWVASKCRLERWNLALATFSRDVRQPSPDHDPWPAIETVVQEVLVSELPTRLWTAITHHRYQRDCAAGGTDPAGDLLGDAFDDPWHGPSHAVLVGHLEARNRCLRLLIAGRGQAERAAERLDALRRQVERWTDWLLAVLPAAPALASLGFDSRRIRDFASYHSARPPHSAWPPARRAGPPPAADHAAESDFRHPAAIVQKIADDLNRLSSRLPANPDLNRQIAVSLWTAAASPLDHAAAPPVLEQVQLQLAVETAKLLADALLDHD